MCIRDSIGPAAVAPYETPGTQAFAETILPFVHEHNTILLQNHGLVCWSDTVTHAEWLCEIMDTYCRTYMIAKQIGEPLGVIPEDKIDDILRRKQWMGCLLYTSFHVGAAINERQIAGTDEIGDSILAAQFDSISPENVLKWERVHPRLDAYNFELADKYVAFGEKNHMFIVGHNLVWHSQVPNWVFQDDQGKPLTRDALLKRMHDLSLIHI